MGLNGRATATSPRSAPVHSSQDAGAAIGLVSSERLSVILSAFLERHVGNGEQEFLERFNIAHSLLEKNLPAEVTAERKASLIADWFEYKLGLRPKEDVDPRVFSGMP